MTNLVSHVSCRALLALAVLGLSACASKDEAPPSLIAAQFLDAEGNDPVDLGVLTSPAMAEDEAYAEVPTLGSIRLVFSELLDGDTVVELERDEVTGDVTGFVSRDGIVRIAPADGSILESVVAYEPSGPAILADAGDYLPAETLIQVNVMGDRVRDKDGNLLAAAVDEATGEPFRDADNRGIAASAAYYTAAIQLTGTVIPAYGEVDDPATTGEDEAVPYDAAVEIGFNTAMDPTSFAGLVRFVPLDDNGDPSGPVIAGTPAAGADATFVAVTPATPLAPAHDYELHIAPGGADQYGVPYAGPITVEAFSTL